MLCTLAVPAIADAGPGRVSAVEVFAHGQFSTVAPERGTFRAHVSPLGTFDLTVVPDPASIRDVAVDATAAALSYTQDAAYTFRSKSGDVEGTSASRLTIALQRSADGSLVRSPDGRVVPDLRVPISIDATVRVVGGTKRFRTITGTLDIDMIILAPSSSATTLDSYARGSGTLSLTPDH